MPAMFLVDGLLHHKEKEGRATEGPSTRSDLGLGHKAWQRREVS